MYIVSLLHKIVSIIGRSSSSDSIITISIIIIIVIIIILLVIIIFTILVIIQHVNLLQTPFNLLLVLPYMLTYQDFSLLA